MATIREDEPAEGLRKENREISAKMKEDEQMQKDTDAEKRTEATEAGAQPPKKKNIIQVFRPQNSKTGMVKPGARRGNGRAQASRAQSRQQRQREHAEGDDFGKRLRKRWLRQRRLRRQRQLHR